MITFRKVHPDEKNLMEQIFKLRYQVYTIERSFLPSENYPKQLEQDDFDRQSTHFAAFNDEEKVLGSVRMILAQPRMVPVQKFCPGVPFEEICRLQNAAEISRLVISKKSRKLFRDNRISEEEVVVGLCQAMYEFCQTEGITHTFALMEKTLWQLLRRYGFQFHCLGHEVDMYGPVKPYVCAVSAIEWAEIIPEESPVLTARFPLPGTLAVA